MPTTPNLEITHIEQSQAQKEVTANEAFTVLDAALTEGAVSIPTDANYTLSAITAPKEWQYGILKVSSGVALTATRAKRIVVTRALSSLHPGRALARCGSGGAARRSVSGRRGVRTGIACPVVGNSLDRREQASSLGGDRDAAHAARVGGVRRSSWQLDRAPARG